MTIEMKLSSIYDAAHRALPDKAASFGDQATTLGDALGPAVREARNAGADGLAQNLEDLGGELFHRLRIMVRTMNDSAVALDEIADDFAHTDDEAAAWFASHIDWQKHHPRLGQRPDTPSLPHLSEDRGSSW